MCAVDNPGSLSFICDFRIDVLILFSYYGELLLFRRFGNCYLFLGQVVHAFDDALLANTTVVWILLLAEDVVAKTN